MDKNLYSQYKDLYLETGRTYLDQIQSHLVTLRHRRHDVQAASEIYRLSHSLKSSSIAMRFSNTASVCGMIEDIFKKVQSGVVQVADELLEMLDDAVAQLKEDMDSIEKDNKEKNLAEILRVLKRIADL